MDTRFVEDINQFCRDVQVHSGGGGSRLIDGKYGKVSVIRHTPTDKLFLKKTIKHENFDAIELTVHHLMRDHSNFIKLYYAFNTPKIHVLIMDYVEDGDLFEILKMDGPFSERKTANVVSQLVFALNSLHKHRIIHNDVKLENVLYTRSNRRVQLCDYGLCKPIGAVQKQDGTVDYFSPEKIRDQPYDETMDFWAVGVIAYELLSGEHPYKDGKDDDLDVDILKYRIEKSFRPIRKRDISEVAIDFIKNMLHPNVKSRLCKIKHITIHDFLYKEYEQYK
ncbi:protein kinase [Spodoptera littoralis nucleopolyhedrovirus]|uniref:non-specific serine/threonine protein kinase n=1 Tax=Spodoptera littoralis nuclear polyhedrosis virus TaxID=10456 RepID=M1JNN0_NPVSL|nr:protein kinase [Spodoptera littoralis nucleopolyhedrovirus]AGE89858.1 protein kinase [Spodoptera littoralis nucleopolyhedrovirus]